MTILSFRIASVKEERESKAFRNPSHNSDTKIFAQIFSLPHLSNSAACFAAKACKAHRSYEVIPDADERRFFAACSILADRRFNIANSDWIACDKSRMATDIEVH